MTAYIAEGGSVKLKKLANGTYGWEVAVAAATPALDDLRAAKETARRVIEELEREFDQPAASTDRW